LLLYLALFHGLILVVGDISTAFLHADLEKGTKIALRPPPTEGRGKLWVLFKAIYGLRRSPQLFQRFLARVLVSYGWHRSQVDGQFYWHDCGAYLSIHADDILLAVAPQEMNRVKQELEEQLVIKWGDEIGENWTRYLGRLWRRTPVGLECRVPLEYYQSIFKVLGLEAAKPIRSPECHMSELCRGESPALGAVEAEQFRSALGKVLWLSMTRWDVMYISKELARHAREPSQAAMTSLKRLVRYLKGTTAVVLKMSIDELQLPQNLEAYTDANWATDTGRKSTSGGIVFLQGFPMQAWSKTQGPVALSSCEAELMAVTLTCQECLMLESLLKELKLPCDITIRCDSSAAVAAAHRLGVGHLKHIQVRHLFVQQLVADKRILLRAVRSEDNLADLFTKPLIGSRFRTLAQRCGIDLSFYDDRREEVTAVLMMMEPGQAEEEEEEEPWSAQHATMALIVFCALAFVVEKGVMLVRWLCRKARRLASWACGCGQTLTTEEVCRQAIARPKRRAGALSGSQ
jgi:hypothetical protein